MKFSYVTCCFLGNTTAAGRLVGIHNIPGLDTVPHFRKIGMPRGRFARFGIHAGIILQSRGEWAWMLDASPPGSKVNHQFLPELVVHWLATNGHERRQGGILLCLVCNTCCLAAQHLVECWRDGLWSCVDLTPVVEGTAIPGL